jgi:hypothetical protein
VHLKNLLLAKFCSPRTGAMCAVSLWGMSRAWVATALDGVRMKGGHTYRGIPRKQLKIR